MSTIIAEPSTEDVAIGRERLEGVLAWPGKTGGLVMFAHGSGSSRFSPRNTRVARQLQTQGVATLLFDLLTEHQAYDVAMLGERMVEAVRFARSEAALSRLPIGLFGASTGAAAALVATAKRSQDVAAVVSRGGRPDLAGSALAHVRAATLPRPRSTWSRACSSTAASKQINALWPIYACRCSADAGYTADLSV